MNSQSVNWDRSKLISPGVGGRPEAPINLLATARQEASKSAFANHSKQPAQAARSAPSARRFPPAPHGVRCISMGYSIENYAIDPESGRQLMNAFTTLSDDCHYRYEVEGAFGHGQHEFCGFTDGFYVTFSEAEYHGSSTAFIHSPDTLQLYLGTSGDGEYVPFEGMPLSFEAPSMTLIIEPAEVLPAELTFAGRTRYVYIAIHREALKALHGGDEHELPAVIRAFLNGELRQTVGHALPLDGALLRSLDEIHSVTLRGRRRRLYLQSKIVEILCQTFEAIDLCEHGLPLETSRLTERGVLKARRLLMENFVTPPSLEELALNVGLCRSGLCAGFRQILGQSVFDFIQELRMQEALKILKQRELSITQIAHAIGYSHASSFSVAVQRHFGTTPTELRRRGAMPKREGSGGAA